jgi:hypothetical protein
MSRLGSTRIYFITFVWVAHFVPNQKENEIIFKNMWLQTSCIMVYKSLLAIDALLHNLPCCIIHKNRYKTTTLAILKNGPNTNYSILVEGFKFS